MDLNTDFRDMLVELSVANVDYLIVGAYAVAAHGYPRATGDLDIWVRADVQTAPKLMRALARFGAPVDQVSESDFATPSCVFQIGVPPGRIDILTAISGVQFDSAWKNRIVIRIEDLELNVIGKVDLLLNKKASGRPKDLADIQGLKDSEGAD